MKWLELEDRLYTSTEVAKILGVSLRSVYRYLEDGKLDAEMKTATGRHRFTKQNILDFLSPQQGKRPVVETSEDEETLPEIKTKKAPAKKAVEVEEVEAEEDSSEVEEPEEDEEVDWLAKFRAAAERYKSEVAKDADEEEEVAAEEETEDEVEVEAEAEVEMVSGLGVSDEDTDEEEVEVKVSSNEYYYTSSAGGLKDVAQNLDKSARKASLDYAFTMDAGLSLHKPIKPFSVIHAYVRSEDLPFFEKILNLKSANASDGQLCLLVSESDAIYKDSREMHGLKVVADSQLKKDLISAGKEDLASEL